MIAGAGLLVGDRAVVGRRIFLTTGLWADPSRFVNPMSPKQPQFTPKAKSVIFLFMYGGPSHVDTFDYKPKLYPLDGKTIEVKTFGRGGHRNQGRVVGPKWDFHQYGQCGKWVSDLFPNLARRVDDIAFIHSMYAESPIHGSAMLMMNSGRILSGHPALGSWATYGWGAKTKICLASSSCSTRRGTDQRTEELVERLHAGRLSGHGHSRRNADP